MKKYLIIMLLAAFGFAMTGCRNTAEGVGADLENMGEDIQREVD